MSTKYISNILFNDKLDKSSYLNELPVIKYLKQSGQLDFSADVTFFIGENGTGKSTLLEAMESIELRKIMVHLMETA